VARLKPAQFDERMTLVEHLDELRTRIVISLFVLVIACGLCFWQNELLRDIANGPLPAEVEDQPTTFAPTDAAPAETADGDDIQPTTLSPTEPFFTTLKLSIYAGILLALPILLYQAYAFFLPALAPHEKKVILPFLLMVPFLFMGGVVFAYFVVVPAAASFLLNFNADAFDIQLRANEWYGFFLLTLAAVGILFQIPVGVLAVTRLGIVTPEQLAHNRRYAVLIIAVLAMLLPGTDPVTMVIAMIPLLLLYELSIQLSKVFGRPPGEPESDLSPTDPAAGETG
jgi:sec-independent protein translocase protein TatC